MVAGGRSEAETSGRSFQSIGIPEGCQTSSHGLLNHECADAEYRVAFLPSEGGLQSPRGPIGCCLFQFANEVGDAVSGFQTDQGVHVILDAANPERDSAESTNGTAEILVKV